MSLSLDQPRAGRVVFPCPQPALNLALGEVGVGAGIALLPQSCSWLRAGAPGRDGSQMWMPEQSLLPSPDHCPSQASLKLNEGQAAYLVVPGVIFNWG